MRSVHQIGATIIRGATETCKYAKIVEHAFKASTLLISFL
jgi:hypothetical protein